VQLAADVVVDAVQVSVLAVERVAAGGRALAQQDTLGPTGGDLDAGGDGVRPIPDLRTREVRDRLGVRPVRVTVAGQGHQRFLRDHPREPAAVEVGRNWGSGAVDGYQALVTIASAASLSASAENRASQALCDDRVDAFGGING